MENTMQENRFFEKYLTTTGWGLYNNFILGLTCACNFVHASTFVIMPFALSLSSCTTNFIPEYVSLKIFTSFYLGSSIGTLIANSLSDRYGRKRYLSYSLMFTFLSTFSAAFAYNAYVIIGASLFLGVGLETNLTSVKLLMIEILPKKKRGTYMVFCSIFWALGYVLTSVLTILFETPAITNTVKTPDTSLTTWRIMFAVCGGANLLLACACALIEESPRYFLQMGRSYLAYLVLKQMFAINNSSFAENFKVKEDDVKNLIPHHGLFYMEPVQHWDIFKKLIWRFYTSLKLLFSKRFCQTTVALILLKIPLLVIGILQLDITLAKKLTVSTSTNISHYKYRGLDFVYPVFKPISYMTREELRKATHICAINEHNSTFYRYFLLLGSAMMPGLVISMLTVDRIGRKLLLFLGFLLSGCSFLILRYVKQNTIQLVASCIILSWISSAISISSLVTLEVYPTAIRGTSCGVTSFIGLFLTGFFINLIVIEPNIFIMIMGVLCLCYKVLCDIMIPIMMLAAFCTGVSPLTLLLPELKGKPMTE